jgi:transposase InsO family protein
MLKSNVQHIKNAVSSPQANGQVERINRTLKSMLSKLSDPLDHSDWSKKLEEVEFTMNNSTHSSTKTTPSILLFGTLQRGKIVDEFSEYLEDLLNDTAERDLTNIRQTAAENIETSQKYNEQYYLKHSQPAKTYNIGDLVVIRNVDNTVVQNKKV